MVKKVLHWLKEVRCKKCGKLIVKATGTVSYVCPRCKTSADVVVE